MALAGAAAVAATLGAPRLARAAAWPSERPIRVIVPLPPGGTADFLARLVAQHLPERIGQSVVVENRSGAAGAIGLAAAARSAPDGYTFVLADNSVTSAVPLGRQPPVDPREDLAPVSLLVEYPAVILVGARSPARTLEELLAMARTRPGELTYGSGGNGSAPHLATELLADLAGVQLNHIGYRGMAPATADLAGGRLDMVISVVPTVRGVLAAGEVRALAVATAGGRVPALPDVPTAREAGLDFALGFWFGLMAPRGVDPAVAERLQREVAAVLAGPETRARLDEQGAVVVANDPQSFRRIIADDVERWTRLVREKGIAL